MLIGRRRVKCLEEATIRADDNSIHADLAHASTLPAVFYLDPDFHEREKETIFANSWQIAGRAEQVAKPGSFIALDIAGEPVSIVRGDDDKLRAFSNVCRHRGSLILDGQGCTKVLKCPYHAWTYDLNGELQHAPEFEGVQNWNRSEVRLPEFHAEVFGPLLFVNLGKTPIPFADVVGQIPRDIERHGFPLQSYRFLTRTEYIINCNWKVYVDNYLEGYHLPSVHPALTRELDYKQYRVDTFRYYSSQWAPLRADSASVEERRYRTDENTPAPLYYWIFPNSMISIYPDNLHATIVLPLGVDKTLTIFDWYTLPDAAKSLESTIEFSDHVQQEDIAICEKVQKGLHSRSYDRGRFSVARENGVHHFHRLIAEFSAMSNGGW